VDSDHEKQTKLKSNCLMNFISLEKTAVGDIRKETSRDADRRRARFAHACGRACAFSKKYGAL
jgi:hypothetical protein